MRMMKILLMMPVIEANIEVMMDCNEVIPHLDYTLEMLDCISATIAMENMLVMLDCIEVMLAKVTTMNSQID